MTKIESLFIAWRNAVERAENPANPDGHMRAACAVAADLEQRIADLPAVTARDWQIKVALACHCDPAGDGPAHLALATEALTALGLTEFLPRAAA